MTNDGAPRESAADLDSALWPGGGASHRVGRRVRALRRAAGWTQADLAQRLGLYGVSLSQATIAKLEVAKRPTTVDELAALAQVFGVSMAQLVVDAPQDGDSAPLQQDMTDDVLRIELAQAKESLQRLYDQEVEAGPKIDKMRMRLSVLELERRDRRNRIIEAANALEYLLPLAEEVGLDLATTDDPALAGLAALRRNVTDLLLGSIDSDDQQG